jgi:phosphoglycerol transferase MdoB-like AlkP superfamily enzyme
MEPEVVEKPLSSLDILPTVMNLMGLEYDSRLLMGKDVFSDLPSLVIFFNKSFITDKGKYNSIEGEFYPFEGEFIEDNYVQGVIDEIDRKFYYSMKILDMDYYRFVFEQ